MVQQRTDHVAQAQGRLLEQFADRPKILGLVNSLVRQVQDLESGIFDVIYARLLENAVGVQLDHLGALVGQPRGGMGDPEYKIFIAARMRVNRSHGTPVDVLAVATLILTASPDFHIDEFFPATTTLEERSQLQILVRVAGELLRNTRAAGVRFNLVYTTVPPTTSLELSGSHGTVVTDDALKGFSNGHVVPADTGGHLNGVTV